MNISNHLGSVRVLVDGLVVADNLSESSISNYILLPGDMQAKIDVQTADSHTSLLHASAALVSSKSYDIDVSGTAAAPILAVEQNLTSRASFFNYTDESILITVYNDGTVASKDTILPYAVLNLFLPDGDRFVVTFNDSGPGLAHAANRDYIFTKRDGLLMVQIQNQ